MKISFNHLEGLKCFTFQKYKTCENTTQLVQGSTKKWHKSDNKTILIWLSPKDWVKRGDLQLTESSTPPELHKNTSLQLNTQLLPYRQTKAVFFLMEYTITHTFSSSQHTKCQRAESHKEAFSHYWDDDKADGGITNSPLTLWWHWRSWERMPKYFQAT